MPVEFTKITQKSGSKEKPKVTKEQREQREQMQTFMNRWNELSDFRRNLNKALKQKEESAFTAELKAELSKKFIPFNKAFTMFDKAFNEFLKQPTKIVPVPLLKAQQVLIEMKNEMEITYKKIEKKHRIIEERKIISEYKKTSIENIKFRRWKESDAADFSNFVAENASTPENLNKLLKSNPYLWNPKGNSELYYHQQCAETAILLLIHYCYKNHIDLALPASDRYEALSRYKTIEDYMRAVYPKLSASHLFYGAGGMFKQVSESEVKPGDIYTAKHPPPQGGFHAQMVVKNDKGKMDYLTGNQLNRDFKSSAKVRQKVEKVYRIGFVDPQPDAKPEEVKKTMKWGGYGDKPKILTVEEQQRRTLRVSAARSAKLPKDEIRYYRLDPNRMNNIVASISRQQKEVT